MINENSTYYHKQVEATFANAYNAIQNLMKASDADLNMPEFAMLAAFPEKIQWSQYQSVANLNLKEEELSDDQKEEIALASKESLDEDISFLNFMAYVIKSSQDYNRCLKKLEAISMEASQVFASISKNTLTTDEENPTLTLTHKELYYALTFLNEDQLRDTLYGQQPLVVDKLYNAILEKDFIAFQAALNEHQIIPIRLLKPILIGAMNKVYPYAEYIKSPELINSPFMNVLLDENGFSEEFLDYFDTVKEIQSLNSENMSAMCASVDMDFEKLYKFKIQHITIAHKLLLCSMDIPRFYRKKVLENYNQWRKDYPEAPDINIPEESDFDMQNVANVSSVLIDKWLINAIHKKMEEINSYTASNGNLVNTYNSDVVENRKANNTLRFKFPDRIKVYSNHYNAILTEIYKYYGGGFEDMSCEDFIYLFGGTGKMPKSYAPPFYFMNDDARLKALIRILYVRQPRKFGNIILHISDKATGAIYHDWGVNKKGASYIDDEKLIQSIVSSIAGVKMESL